jgi:hypothetical protein
MAQTKETSGAHIYTCLDADCEWVGDNPKENQRCEGVLCCPLCGRYVESLETLTERMEDLTILIKRIARHLAFEK